jgi:predicted permease
MRESTAQRVLGLLLRLYPESFRWDVGADLVATTLERWREARAQSGAIGETAFWLTEGLRFALDGVLERGRSVWLGATAELRQAWRQVVRAPRHYGVAVLTLALGIGATTTIFTVADTVVFRPLPYESAERLHLVHTRLGALELSSNSLPNLLDARQAVPAMEWLGGAADRSPALTDGVTAAERISVLDVTADYLPGLGARVQLGRPFHAEDFDADAERVAIVSHGLWQRRWGGEAAVIGSTIDLDGTTHVVIGVMHVSFRDPAPIESGTSTGAWIPARAAGGVYHNRDYYAFHVIGRLAEHASIEVVRQQLEAVGAALAAAYPEANQYNGQPMQFVLRPLREATVGAARARLLLLLGAVVLLLLLSCANVANLFLARGVERSAELAVRSALGASRARLAAQLFGESLCTATVASAAGAALAYFGVRAFVALAPSGMPRLAEVALDARVLGFVVLLTLATAVVFGTLPAARGAASATRTVAGGRHTPGRSAQRFQSALLGAEVALSLVLLTGAALLLNSFRHLLSVDPGFTADDVLAVDVRPPRTASSHMEELQFYDALALRAAAVPGVQSVALMYSVPGVHGGAWSRITTDHEAAVGAATQRATAPVQSLLDPGEDYYRLNPVRGDAFAVLGMRLVAGRTFDGDPGPGDPLHVVLNGAAARRLFPDDERPLGRLIALGEPGAGAPMREVVGIIGNVRQRGPAAEPDAQIYLPYGQRDIPRMTLLLGIAPGSPVDAGVLREVIRDVAPDVPVDRAERLSARYAAASHEQRFLTVLLTVFAALGLLMAVVGTYALAAQAAARRIREYGVRMALGAASFSLFRLAVSRTLVVAAGGIAAGIVASILLARFLESHIHGIGARDPLTLAVSAMLIALSAAAASMLPAMRAARVDPNDVLRAE